MKAAGWGHVQQAAKYDEWLSSQQQDSRAQRWARASANDWVRRQNATIAAAHNRRAPGACAQLDLLHT